MGFSKNDPRPFGVHKQVKSALFEPIASHFGPSKVTKCLENGLFWDQKWVKKGSKMVFSKNDPRPFGVHKQVKSALFEPIASHFGPSKVTKCLENGLFWDQKWVKKGSKMVFSKNDPRPFGVHKQVKSALFEPIASHFGPSKVTKCLENGLFWDKKMGRKRVQNGFFQK